VGYDNVGWDKIDMTTQHLTSKIAAVEMTAANLNTKVDEIEKPKQMSVGKLSL
jgi:hypothetical protein